MVKQGADVGVNALHRGRSDGQRGSVVAYDLSQLHRNTANFFNFKAEMERSGILVFTATEGLVRADERFNFNADEWDEKFAAIVAATVAQRTNLDANALARPCKGTGGR